MPKQILKIDQFHGGLNSNSDPRDIANNELSDATDIMVDELGRIRLQGGNSASNMPSNNAATLNPGYGLFQFSHDRMGAHIAFVNNTTEHLDETDFASDAEWDVTGKCVDSGGNLTWTFGSYALGGTAQQAYGDRAIPGIGGIQYTFQYTIAVTTAPDYFTLTLENFPAASTTLPFTAGAHSVTFTSHADAATKHFTILGTDDVGGTTTQGEFSITVVSLKITDETGDDYLLMADTSGNANIDIYSRDTTTWGAGIIDLGTTTGMKPTFYAVDGALRVSDGNFGADNTNQWFGYIKRIHFPDLATIASVVETDTYDGWFVKDQEIKAPTTGLASESNLGVYGTTTGGDTTTLTDASPDAFANFTAAQIDGKGYIAVNSTQSPNVYAVIEERDSDTSLGTASTTDWYTSAQIYTIFPAAGTGWNINIIPTASAAAEWAVATYEVATTFIYDNEQESLPFDTGGTFEIASGEYPQLSLSATSPYNPRITGGRVYYREDGTITDWKLLMDIDLYEGSKASGETSWNRWQTPSLLPPFMVTISNTPFVQDTINTYQLLTGVNQESPSLTAEYKTAVVANRIVYIGNVKTKNKNNQDEVLGDAIIKSPVDKFDIFPIDRMLETSIRDGDQIVKLESYADRLLIFKKNKMDLLNISQELEFLEDTFLHKGVSHPAATCKTDFGIAWVNELGCYLYDGQKVNNLLEKQGRQIIKEGDWATFVSTTPMVGYVPRKRQLIVVDGATSSDAGSIYLYDMVTQSWVEGNGTFTANDKTNFVTDWNGDLIHSATSSGIVTKWADVSGVSSKVVMTTKDIDFGHPGIRKKIYKVYLSFKGDASDVQIVYGLDGIDPNRTFNSITSGSDGSSTGSDASPAAKCIAYDAGTQDWLKAELKPSDPGIPNNISSFRLKIVGDTTNNIVSDFEINGISIVYRLKGIK